MTEAAVVSVGSGWLHDFLIFERWRLLGAMLGSFLLGVGVHMIARQAWASARGRLTGATPTESESESPTSRRRSRREA